MSQDMLGNSALAEMAGPVRDFAEKLGGPEGEIWWVGFKRFLRKENPWGTTDSPPPAPNLLKFITTVAVAAVERFVAAERFTRDNSTVKFYDFGSNFRGNFLSKIEEAIPVAELAIHTLTRASLDDPIRLELGPDREETTLAHLYALLSKQPRGEKGALLTNGNANVFYIRDAKGKFWAVYAYWDGIDRGWYVSAGSVESPYWWYRGRQVFSGK